MTGDRWVCRIIEDQDLVARLLMERWGTAVLLMNWRQYTVADVTALGAYDREDELAGLATWSLVDGAAMLFTLDSLGGAGVGSVLLDRVVADARALGARRVRVVTTNDNLPALRFYQKKDFRLATLYPGAVEAYRSFAPTLREKGHDGIPCRDILELEREL